MLSFPHSLASNNLAGETGYIKTSEVQGSSFEVGAKVTYEGREMTVSMAPDSDGDIKMIDLSGVMALAACLPECRSLTSLKCAAAAHPQVFAFLLCEHFPSFLCTFLYLRQKPMSSLVPFRAHSFLVRSTSCTRSQTHTPLPHSHLRDAALLVCRVCTKATSSFRRASRACSRTHVTPLWPPCRSLELNQLDDQANQAIKAAAGSGVEIQF